MKEKNITLKSDKKQLVQLKTPVVRIVKTPYRVGTFDKSTLCKDCSDDCGGSY